jgi:hypothetical protein
MKGMNLPNIGCKLIWKDKFGSFKVVDLGNDPSGAQKSPHLEDD